MPLPGEVQTSLFNNMTDNKTSNKPQVSRPFVFKGVKYFDFKELAEALLLNWQDGQEMLFRGKLAMYFDLIENSELQKLCEYAERWYEKDNSNKDQIFFECIYQFSSDITSFYWHGAKFKSVYNFGEELLNALIENKNEQYIKFIDYSLFFDCLKWYASYIGENYAANEKIINYISEQLYKEKLEQTDKALKIANLLTGNSGFKVGGRVFKTIEHFNDYINNLKENYHPAYKWFIFKNKDEIKSLQKMNSIEIENENPEECIFGTYANKPIEWKFLEIKNNQALLLSKNILFKDCFDDKGTGTWSESSLRKKLNVEFFKECFTQKEQNKILTRHNSVNSGDTEDKIFLLSKDELNQYFNSNQERIATRLDGQESWWWLCSRGNGDSLAAYGGRGGRVYDEGNPADSSGGVRVALLLNLES